MTDEITRVRRERRVATCARRAGAAEGPGPGEGAICQGATMTRRLRGRMGRGVHRWAVRLCVLVALVGPAAARAAGGRGGDDAAGRVVVVLVGDSTVADGSGWGPGFARRLGAGAVCVNMARSGRSSK